MRATVFLEVFGTTTEQLGTRFEENRARIEPLLSDRIRLGISPHAPYSCSPELYAACLALELPITTHLSESVDEALWMESGTGGWEPLREVLPPPPGRSGIRELAEHGLLTRGLLAAHCVTVDDEEIGLLARHGVTVAHCPRSNGILGCGTAPVAALREAGVPVCLATDSPASTPSFDMFDEIRTAVVVARSRERVPTRSRPATRSRWRRSTARARSVSTPRSARSCPANKRTWPSSHSKARRSRHLKTLLRPSSWVAPRIV